MIKEFTVKTSKRNEFIDITDKVADIVRESGVQEGTCTVFIPHTTAGVTINEKADPNVVRDIISALEKLVPEGAGYRHLEGNSDSHIKSTLVGASERMVISSGRLLLGTWQAIFFCEFDGPRTRRCIVQVIKA
mgnify:CR=1 FL=1